MGFIHVTVEVCNPSEPENSIPIPVLVDTGETLSVLPTALLERLEIRRIQRRRVFGFAGDAERDIGTANMRYLDAEAGITVAFGEPGDTADYGRNRARSAGLQRGPGQQQTRPREYAGVNRDAARVGRGVCPTRRWLID